MSSAKPPGRPSIVDAIAELHKLSQQRLKSARQEARSSGQLAAGEIKQEERDARALEKRLAPSIAWLRDHDSVTIRVFSNCLAGLKPQYEQMLIIESKADKERKRFIGILESCVGTKLKAVNPEATPARQRFPVEELFNTARARQLGLHDELRRRWRPDSKTSSESRMRDVDRLLGIVDVAIKKRGISREEFLLKGTMKDLYGCYAKDLIRTTKLPVGPREFAAYVNQKKYTFSPGTRKAALAHFVRGLLQPELTKA
jgi:hypothetical protein